ncbi:hypothetical protein TNCV_253621 [Trichonephila clavipes]|nr:hypothetical protein TNCV_253621 [Trichonephila clavipes]
MFRFQKRTFFEKNGYKPFQEKILLHQSIRRKYNESRLVDHARFNDETDNENHNDEIINGESIPIYSFIVLKIFIYDGLSRGNCCYCEHIKDGPCFNGATSAQKLLMTNPTVNLPEKS